MLTTYYSILYKVRVEGIISVFLKHFPSEIL